MATNASWNWTDVLSKVVSTTSQIAFDPNVQEAAKKIYSHAADGEKDLKVYARAISSGTISGGARVAHPYISMAIFAIIVTIAQKIFKSLLCYVVRENVGFVIMIVTSVTIGMIFRILSNKYLSGMRISFTDRIADKIVLFITLENLEKLVEKSHWTVPYLVLFGISGLMFLFHSIGLTFWTIGETIFVFTINLAVAQFFY